jgi:hypothetical protein
VATQLVNCLNALQYALVPAVHLSARVFARNSSLRGVENIA